MPRQHHLAKSKRKNVNRIKIKKSSTSSSKTSKSKTPKSKTRKSKTPKSKIRKSKTPTIKLCDTCLKIKNVDGNLMSKNNESWKTFPHHLPILGRNRGSQEVRINLGKKHGNCLIYYFGAE